MCELGGKGGEWDGSSRDLCGWRDVKLQELAISTSTGREPVWPSGIKALGW